MRRDGARKCLRSGNTIRYGGNKLRKGTVDNHIVCDTTVPYKYNKKGDIDKYPFVRIKIGDTSHKKMKKTINKHKSKKPSILKPYYDYDYETNSDIEEIDYFGMDEIKYSKKIFGHEYIYSDSSSDSDNDEPQIKPIPKEMEGALCVIS
jgi:hypothetical protein